MSRQALLLKEVLRKTKVPPPINTQFENQSPFLHFASWNGQLWNIETLPMYQQHIRLTFEPQALRKNLSAAQDRLDNHAFPQGLDYHLRDYYKAKLKANQSVKNLLELCFDLKTVASLLRTAPNRIFFELESAWMTYDRSAFDLAWSVEELHSIRMIMSIAHTSPLMFSFQVTCWQRCLGPRFRIRRAYDFEISTAKTKTAVFLRRKKAENQSVYEQITLNPPHQLQTSLEETRDQLRKYPVEKLLKEIWNSDIRLWAVEALQSTMARRFSTMGINIRNWTGPANSRKEVAALRDIKLDHRLPIYHEYQRILRKSAETINELLGLSKELEVLRYYKITHFPHLDLSEEIRAAQRYYRRQEKLERSGAFKLPLDWRLIETEDIGME